MDYFYLGRKEEPNEALPLLAILDQATQRVFSVSLPMKGLGHQYNAAVVAKLFKILGHQHSVLKTDTERSLVALRTAVQQQLPNLSFEDAIKGESQTNGPIESAVGRLQAQARTLKSALEFNYELANVELMVGHRTNGPQGKLGRSSCQSLVSASSISPSRVSVREENWRPSSRKASTWASRRAPA